MQNDTLIPLLFLFIYNKVIFRFRVIRVYLVDNNYCFFKNVIIMAARTCDIKSK